MDWGWIYGHISTTTGYSRREIDDLTLPEVYELFDYWNVHPPTHILVAARMGIKPDASGQRNKNLVNKTEEPWWETIEDDYSNQDLAGLLASAPAKIRRDGV